MHLLGTGIKHSGLNLSTISSLGDFKTLRLKPIYFKEEWLVGFGWDENNIFPFKQSGNLPRAADLDLYFPDKPVAFTRADGHALWLNTFALKKLGYYQNTQLTDPNGGVIVRDSVGNPSGLFLEQAKIDVDIQLPDYTNQNKCLFIDEAIKHFNKSGFTHVRDMSCDLFLWEYLKNLEMKNRLTIFYEGNFTVEGIKDLDRCYGDIKFAKQDQLKRMRVRGAKVFYDGSLGSETALLSQNYENRIHNGIKIWTDEEIQKVLRYFWEKEVEVSFHTLGDQAVYNIAYQAALIKRSGLQGKINFEHVELINPQTIPLLKELNATCYLQPCHWLSDKTWVDKKIAHLKRYLFRWKELENQSIGFFWGSDSPIEEPSIFNNQLALLDAEKSGIPKTQHFEIYHSHPDPQWGAGTFSEFENQMVKQVFIEGLSLT